MKVVCCYGSRKTGMSIRRSRSIKSLRFNIVLRQITAHGANDVILTLEKLHALLQVWSISFVESQAADAFTGLKVSVVIRYNDVDH